MNVLIACEESQRVYTAFRERGHNAFSCDIIECSGGHPEWHIQGDVLKVLNPSFVPLGDDYGTKIKGIEFKTCDGKEHFVNGRWDLIIAHPPCTYLSNAGACRLYPKKGQLDQERYLKGLEGKEFFLKMLNADCERVCVENPVSSKVFEMPPHTQEIQPWQFGHPVSKKTRLWLRGLPNLKPTNIVPCETTYLPAGTSRKDTTKYGRAYRTGKDSVQRSKTFEGIARAMSEQWG